jgi:hypothetical protein
MSFSIKSQGHPDARLQVELCNFEVVCILMMAGEVMKTEEFLGCKYP